MSNEYSDWVTVVASDLDSTPVWRGPREAAQEWIDSPEGRAFNRAIAHQGDKLQIREGLGFDK